MAQYSWPSVTVSSTNPANGTPGVTAPSTATEVGGVDPSGNLQALKLTAAKALTVDGSGVTQPISAASLPLPSGAATSANQTTANTSLSSIDTKTPALVVGRVPVDGSGVTQPVSGSVSVSNFPGTQAVSGTVSVSNLPATQAVSAASLPLPAGAATSALQTTGNTSLASIDTKLGSALAVTQSGTWTVQPGNTANTTAWLVGEVVASTGTITSVTSVATSATLLAANTARKHATFFNDSTATLYLALSSTASTTAYTVQIQASGYYELPYGKIYSGAVSGIWSAANGAVRITELT